MIKFCRFSTTAVFRFLHAADEGFSVKPLRYILPLLILHAAVLVWGPSPARGGAFPISIFVSVIPQKFFVKKIGAEWVTVEAMVRPGANPATYEPRPSQMRALAGARVYFAIGVPFEKTWMKKIAAANPRLKIVYTQQGIKKIPMTSFLNPQNPQSKKNHRHGILDPHIWLSPPLVKLQAQHIYHALAEADPLHGAQYEANYHRFIQEIEALDTDLRHVFADKQGLEFMVFHPSWGYFALEYGLRQVPVEIEGKGPKPGQLKQLIEQARERGIRVLFVQPQFSRKSADLIARAIGARIVEADPLAEDWEQNLRHQASAIRKTLK